MIDTHLVFIIHLASIFLQMSGEGTVKDHSPFNPQHDAEVLRKAMKGFGMCCKYCFVVKFAQILCFMRPPPPPSKHSYIRAYVCVSC